MSRLLIFPVGISLLHCIADRKRLRINNHESLIELLQTKMPDDILTNPLERSDSFKYLRDVLKRMSNVPLDSDKGTKKSRSTAELSALAALQRQGDFARNDELVLLASNTGEGAFCALATGLAVADQLMLVEIPSDSSKPLTLEQHKFEWGSKSVWAREEGEDPLMNIRLNRASIVVIPNLDPTQKAEFEDVRNGGLINLARVILDLIYRQERGADRIVLNITGGYKASLPMLTQMIAVIKNDEDLAHKLRVFCLFEEAVDLVEEPIIPLEMEAAGDIFEDNKWKHDFGVVPPRLQTALFTAEHEFNLLGWIMQKIYEAQKR